MKKVDQRRIRRWQLLQRGGRQSGVLSELGPYMGHRPPRLARRVPWQIDESFEETYGICSNCRINLATASQAREGVVHLQYGSATI